MFPLHGNVEGYGLTMMIGYGQLLIICTRVTMLNSLLVTLKWQSWILKVKLKNPLFEQGHPVLNPNLIEDQEHGGWGLVQVLLSCQLHKPKSRENQN